MNIKLTTEESNYILARINSNNLYLNSVQVHEASLAALRKSISLNNSEVETQTEKIFNDHNISKDAYKISKLEKDKEGFYFELVEVKEDDATEPA